MSRFTKLRQALLDNEELRKELEELKQVTDKRFQIWAESEASDTCTAEYLDPVRGN